MKSEAFLHGMLSEGPLSPSSRVEDKGSLTSKLSLPVDFPVFGPSPSTTILLLSPDLLLKMCALISPFTLICIIIIIADITPNIQAKHHLQMWFVSSYCSSLFYSHFDHSIARTLGKQKCVRHHLCPQKNVLPFRRERHPLALQSWIEQGTLRCVSNEWCRS